MRKIGATFGPHANSRVARVTSLTELAREWTPDHNFLVQVQTPSEIELADRLRSQQVPNVSWIASSEVQFGDVVSPQPSKSGALVHFRRTDIHHTLFVTNRCNSNCLMCSQPPTSHDDSWLVDEAIDIARHMGNSPEVLGLTGGEPLLLRADLRRLLDAIACQHPSTAIEVLTNGRLFSDAELASHTLDGLRGNVSWLVPLYGHADFLHDFVVQSFGAFDETIGGLLALQHHKQAVQLRVVLIEPVLRVLPELCRFIAANLPFVREVALMSCEPTGFALANRDHCEVDLVDWRDCLDKATHELKRRNVPFILMNTPLCALPRRLWDRAHRSISDWKNTFAPECDACVMKKGCSGLFASHSKGWRPTKIRPITEAFA